LIKRHAAKVYMLFDSDAAGRKATIRSMELFMEQRLPAYVISLPVGDDPDSFLAGNPVEAFRTCQEKARPAFEFFVRSLLAQTPPDSVDSKVRIIDELLPRFKKIADPVERDLYEKEICRLLGITVHAFRKRMGGMNLTTRDTQGEQNHSVQKGDPTQEMLLALICSYPEARSEVAMAGAENLFEGDCLELARLVLETMANNDNAQALSHLLDNIEAPDVRALLSRILVSDAQMADIDWRSAFNSCMRSREKQAILPIRGIAAQLAVLDPDSPEYSALLKKAEVLRTRKSKIQP
jgi:DNA primase